jgi:TPR repeat protein
MLGTLFLTGQGGVTRDPKEAAHWWKMAAEQGYAPAQYNLGGMYSRQLNADLSLDDAKHWLALAADQGHRAAEKELAALATEMPASPAGSAPPATLSAS